MTRDRDDPIEDSWRDLGYPRRDCKSCGKVLNKDGSRVTWRCAVCGHLVCRDCTRRLQARPDEYHELTLCSEECWIAAGKPEE